MASDDLTPVRCGCGGEARIVYIDGEDSEDTYVGCERCGISTPVCPTEEEAVEDWNRAMGRGDPKWWCNLCASYDKQRCYCNLHGIWVASDFGCKAFEPYCDEEELE